MHGHLHSEYLSFFDTLDDDLIRSWARETYELYFGELVQLPDNIPQESPAGRDASDRELFRQIVRFEPYSSTQVSNMDPLQHRATPSNTLRQPSTAEHVRLIQQDPQLRGVYHPASEGSVPMPAIIVRPFRDKHSVEYEGVGLAWNENRFTPITCGSPSELSVSALVTGLAVRALQSGDRVVVVGEPEEPRLGQEDPVDLELEGEIHSFWFDQHASTVLYADISLTLRNASDGDPLWIRDLPEDNTLPIWIGAGMAFGGGLSDALNALGAEFIELFAQKEFASAVEAVRNRSDHLVTSARVTTTQDAGDNPRM